MWGCRVTCASCSCSHRPWVGAAAAWAVRAAVGDKEEEQQLQPAAAGNGGGKGGHKMVNNGALKCAPCSFDVVAAVFYCLVQPWSWSHFGASGLFSIPSRNMHKMLAAHWHVHELVLQSSTFLPAFAFNAVFLSKLYPLVAGAHEFLRAC